MMTPEAMRSGPFNRTGGWMISCWENFKTHVITGLTFAIAGKPTNHIIPENVLYWPNEDGTTQKSGTMKPVESSGSRLHGIHYRNDYVVRVEMDGDCNIGLGNKNPPQEHISRWEWSIKSKSNLIYITKSFSIPSTLCLYDSLGRCMPGHQHQPSESQITCRHFTQYRGVCKISSQFRLYYSYSRGRGEERIELW